MEDLAKNYFPFSISLFRISGVNLGKGCRVYPFVFFLFTVVTLADSSAWAASYQRFDGEIVSPIRFVSSYGGGDHPYSGNDLEPHAELGSADLSGAYLYGADLSEANLQSANLSDVYLKYARLPGADLSWAELMNAVLTSANLSESNLSGANLSHLNLGSANLSGARLDNAYLFDANLYNANLSNSFLLSADFSSARSWSSANWTGARYSLGAVDDEGNPVEDTIFPSGMDPVSLGMIAVPEPTSAFLLGLGLVALTFRRSLR